MKAKHMQNIEPKYKNKIFEYKIHFLKFPTFFQKGDPLKSQLSNFFFHFFKFSKKEIQKQFSFDHSNIERNKVKNFGSSSHYLVETVKEFMVVRDIMAPPHGE